MSESQVGVVLALAVKTAVGGPMRETREIECVADGTVAGNPPASLERGVTLLSWPQWVEVAAELEAAPMSTPADPSDLPWHTRRANVLLDTPRLGPTIGKRLRIGETLLEITGETTPCSLMERLRSGLLKALVPDCRGGVTARILTSGRIRPGDVVVIEEGT